MVLIEGYVDRLSDELLLGNICWYTIPGKAHLEHDRFKELIERYKAPIRIPRPPRPEDCFIRACTNSQRRNVVGGQDVHYNYNVRPAGSTKETAYRKIVRERVDKTGHKLDYVELTTVFYDKATESIYHEHIEADAVADEVLEAIYDYYTEHHGMVTPYVMREAVRKALEGPLQAVSLKPGQGIYFVYQGHTEALERIEGLLAEIDGAFLHPVPLPDVKKQREMLRSAYEAESLDEVDKLIGEMAEHVAAGKKMTLDTVTRYRVAYDEMSEKLSLYSGLLNHGMDMTQSRLDIMQNQIKKLQDQIEL
jgi:hypothetical protein